MQGKKIKYSKKMVDKANVQFKQRNYMPEPKGELNENLVLKLVKECFDLHKVYLSNRKSALDEDLKVDLVIEIAPDSTQVYPLQIKSSETGAIKHLQLEKVIFNGKAYELCPVIIVNRSRKDLVIDLGEFFNLSLESNCQTAIEISKKMFGNDLPKKAFKSRVQYFMNLLDLAQDRGGVYYF